MVDVSDALHGALAAGGAGVRVLQATFVSAATSGCLVDVQGSRVPALLGTSFIPEVNEVVWLWAIDDRFFIMGPAAPKPDQGTVQSVSGGLVTLATDFGTTVVCAYAGTTPSAGQVMKILWHAGPFAFLMSTSPTPGTAPAAPSSGATTHVDQFTAGDSGSYGGRWFTTDVWASDSNLGAWFYGTKIPDTIPAGAVIQKVEIYVSSASRISGSAPNFATHPHQSKPGSAPALSTVGAVGIRPGWVDLGAAGITIGNALKHGGGAYGVGVNHGGYNIFPSLAQDGLSGALRITSVY